ncbi:MAG: hypothetical protein GY929_19125 [Actinomycetia bacterium]|nr:hypothetical protein [Actinomycetes bacterium]
MNEQVMWYVARSAGIVAWALVTLSVLWGLALSTRALGRTAAPAWLLDIHRFLGGLSVTFTAVHLLALVGDNYVYFGWRELFVPMASQWQAGPVAWGIVAFYLLIAVEATSLIMKRLPRRLWKWIHSSSFIIYAFATVHGFTAGTDVANGIYLWASVLSVQAVAFFTVARLLIARRSKRRAPAAATAAAGQVASA